LWSDKKLIFIFVLIFDFFDFLVVYYRSYRNKYCALWQTNYEHLKRCIESAPVPPMSQHLYDNMVKLIPNHLTVKYASVLNELHDEITEEFENTMRKSRGSK